MEKIGAKWCTYPIFWCERGEARVLTGEYFHAIDTKSRVFVPAKLREELGEAFILARNVDGCLSLYHKDEWEKLCQKINSLPSTQTHAIKRFIYTSAYELTPDIHGRITLPQVLREYANLTREAAFLGVGDHAELWDAERWNAMKNGDDAAEIERQMRELGL